MNALKMERRSRAIREMAERKDIANAALDVANAALNNEAITRARVDAIEKRLEVWDSMSLWSRLHWLFKGVK